MSEMKSPKARNANAKQWDLCHMIINTVRKAMGLPLSRAENPYIVAQAEQRKNKYTRKAWKTTPMPFVLNILNI